MKTIDVAFYREGNQWVAQAMDVEVSTFADTLEEARAAMQEALELYFDGNSLKSWSKLQHSQTAAASKLAA